MSRPQETTAAGRRGSTRVPGPIESLIREEDVARVLKAFEELPDDEHQAIDLLLLKGMTERDAEELAGVPRTTLQARYQRGMRKLLSLRD